MIIRLIWNILRILGFVETLILNVIQIVVNWIFYSPIAIENSVGMMNVIYILTIISIALLTVVIFSYFLERQQRRAYYYYLKESKRASWLFNVLDNMNTGFLSIKGDEITYMNDFLSKKLEQSKLFNDKPLEEIANANNPYVETNLIINNKEENTCCLKHNANKLLYSLLSNLHTETINDDYISKILNDFIIELKSQCIRNTQDVPPDYVKKFIECITEIPSISNFVYIGEQTFNSLDENNENNFEVFCRFNKLPFEGSELNLLFNDVTRSKINENLKSEFKYKTLFLSKVAHEFKNPLICISELIKQIYSSPEVQEKLLSTNFDENLAQIKSMSNFLLILVKDLDYFTQSQTEDKIKLENKETDVDELIEFCIEITNSLLIKNNKKEEINFKIVKHADVPKFIMTDEWRLKQVLINLISNAVKFTYYGEILLEISLEILTKPLIRFLVKDTGIGIKPEFLAKLFQPFRKGTGINNEMGAGLGLSIVKELTKKLGGLIEFDSEINKGSSFWFNIPLEKAFSNRQEDHKSVAYIDESENILINNKNDNDSSEHTQMALMVLNKHQLENVKFEDYDNKSSSISLNNLIKLKNRRPSNFIKIENNNPLFSKNFNSQINLSPHNEIHDLHGHEICIRDLSNKDDQEKETYSVLDLVIKNVKQLRLASDNIKIVNVIIADDEKITRQSTIRMIKEVTKDLPIKLNIIESDDGIETIYLLYKSFIQGINISMIFSDETMNYLSGSKSSQIIYDFSQYKHMPTIPFVLVTAYENFTKTKAITEVLTKPLSKANTENVFKELILIN